MLHKASCSTVLSMCTCVHILCLCSYFSIQLFCWIALKSLCWFSRQSFSLSSVKVSHCSKIETVCVKTLSCSIICSNASVTVSNMLHWLSEGWSLISSVFFFKVVGEHSDDIKEGFKKYPQISSPLSGRVLTVVSVVVVESKERMSTTGGVEVCKSITSSFGLIC